MHSPVGRVVASVGLSLFLPHSCLGGVRAIGYRLIGCLGGVHSFSTEWLPRWGKGVLFSLCHYNALSSLCQCDAKKYFFDMY